MRQALFLRVGFFVMADTIKTIRLWAATFVIWPGTAESDMDHFRGITKMIRVDDFFIIPL